MYSKWLGCCALQEREVHGELRVIGHMPCTVGTDEKASQHLMQDNAGYVQTVHSWNTHTHTHTNMHTPHPDTPVCFG